MCSFQWAQGGEALAADAHGPADAARSDMAAGTHSISATTHEGGTPGTPRLPVRE
jgi:hypothetical protein